MDHIFRGEIITDVQCKTMLPLLESVLTQDLQEDRLELSIVINAVTKLIEKIDFIELKYELIAMGLMEWKAEELIGTIKKDMTEEALYLKVKRELGEDFGQWVEVEPGIMEKDQPYGVLMHIGAGNVVALSVISVLEGLLAGNINILKLPSYEGGISVRLLKQLVEIEPKLKPYIYVFDISSRDEKSIKILSQVADAVLVWGSDEAIIGIRHMAPPSLPIIEWGHRLSFAYLTLSENFEEAIIGLAEEICLSNQQYCSSPQSVFVETKDLATLDFVAHKLLKALDEAGKKYPQGDISMNEIGEITWTKEISKMESVLGKHKVVESYNKDHSILIDYEPDLKASPMFRNIWMMPVNRNQILDILRPYKGYLQTVGLECREDECMDISQLFYIAGVNRVTTCGKMSATYVGEPHDGKPTLKEYTRRVSLRK